MKLEPFEQDELWLKQRCLKDKLSMPDDDEKEAFAERVAIKLERFTNKDHVVLAMRNEAYDEFKCDRK